jgi:Calx-beta domain/Right handed beta helix region/IPT/TIG domain
VKSVFSLLRCASAALCLASAPLFAATFTVTNTNDSGPGSLRQALLDANQPPGGHRVEFAIGSGPRTIQPLTNLPEVLRPVVIDGRTQPGYAGKPIVEIDGSLTAGTWATVVGFSLSDAEVWGLVLNGSAGAAIQISKGSIKNYYVGTDVTGTLARGNHQGIRAGYGEGPLVIGGAGANEGNVISANVTGVNVTANTVIVGNTFGTNAARTAVVGTTSQHIAIPYKNTGHVTIGGAAPNVFAGGNLGVSVFYSNGVHITGNHFGRTPGGKVFPIGLAIEVYQSSENLIDGNVIRGNGLAILVNGNALRNRILANSLDNNDYGIDLSPAYGAPRPTSNDGNDSDLGPNNLLNYPVIERATTSGGQTTITGTLTTHPNRAHRIELFASPECNASGQGEGRDLVDWFTVTTDGSGVASFTRTVAALSPGTAVTATATSDLEGTSELSECTPVEGPGRFQFTSTSGSVSEGASVEIEVHRLLGALGTAAVEYHVTGGTATAADFTGGNGMLTFADGESVKQFTIQSTGDPSYEGTETVVLSLSNPAGGATLGFPQTMTLSILDDDPPPAVTVGHVEVEEGNAGTKVVNVPLTLATPLPEPYTALYAIEPGSWDTIPGTDFIAASGSVTFAAGETAKTVPITIVGDTAWEPDDTIAICIVGIWCGDRVTILNDDPTPSVQAEDLRVVEGNGTTTALVTIRASQAISGEFRVSTVGGTAQPSTDFTPRTEFVYFSNQSVKTFAVTILGDREPEPDEQFGIEIVSTDPSYRVGPNGVVTIANDDAGVGPAERWIAAGESKEFTVRLGEKAVADATITIATDSPSAISVAPTLVIAAGQISADLDVSALQAGETANVTLTFPPSLGGATHSVRVRTFARATLRFSPARVMVIDGRTATVSVSLDPPQTVPTTIGVRSTDAARVPSSLTIPAGGSVPLVVTAARIGTFTVTAQLPPVHGNEQQSLYGEVVAEPQTPTIFSVTPSGGTIAGGTHVRVAGAHFEGSCWLFAGDAAMTQVVVRDAQSITGVTAPHAAGASDVTVRCTEGTSSLAAAFTYRNEDDPAPLITEVVPGAAAPGELVTLRGLNFRITDGVAIDSASAEVVDPSPESHVVRVPELPAGASGIALTDALGRTTTTPLFFVLEARPPRITAVSPATVAAGAELELTGEGFRSGYTFHVAGQPATVVAVEYTRAIMRVSARVEPGTYPVRVHNRTGALAALGPDVTVAGAGPVVVSADPHCTTTDGGVHAFVRGRGFVPGMAVTFDAVPSQEVVFIDTATLRVLVPPGAAGPATVAAGGSTLTNGFRYASPFDPRGCGGRGRMVRH